MKTNIVFQFIRLLAYSLTLALLTQPAGIRRLAAAESILSQTHLAIQSIRLEGDEVVVTALVSAGIKTVILESRPRIGDGNWEPRAVQRLGEFTTPVVVITIRALQSADMEVIQLRGETEDVLPPAFFEGGDSQELTVNGLGTAAPPAAVDSFNRDADLEGVAAAPGGGDRTVVESDIWNVDGDTLYFFNQYRGLQVIDIQNPDSPVVQGTYNVPAAGEQMYLYDTDHVVLLTRNNCGGSSSTAESQLILLDVSSGQPNPVVEIPIQGNIRESRLVGTALYLVSERYRPVLIAARAEGDVREVWEWGSEITSFDLSQFSDPVARFSEWVPGYGNAIMATDRFLFVATPQRTSQWWSSNSDVRIFDISAPDGTTVALSSISTAGRVKDKFKMNLKGDVFSVVTETSDRTSRTQVETFSLADPVSPERLGELKIIERETLHATRFHGDTLYVVTFLRVDPLWIIDLSDPAHPRKVSELEIPGWSTFIQPLDGRLITVGIDNTTGWRAAVQLFDVQDPSKPSLVSKIILGERYSSTEANSDEKALGIIPEENLILVPYSSYDQGQTFRGVHLIDLEPDGLRKRGKIDHELQARRATVHRNRVLSISGAELLTVDATDRDNPQTTSTTELSWAADRVFLEGGHLVTASAPYDRSPSLRVVSVDDSASALNQVQLANLPLLGATLENKRLYIVQGKSTEVMWPEVWDPNDYAPIGQNDAVLELSVFDVSNLPEITLLGTSNTTSEDSYWGQFEALWPSSGVLVWHSSNGGFYPGPLFLEADATARVGAPVSDFAGDAISILPRWGNFGGQLVAFDVNDPSAPQFLSEVDLREDKNWWNFGQAFAVEGLVYLSHQASEFLPDVRPPGRRIYEGDEKELEPVVVEPPPGVWVQRYYLNVINFNNPAEPTFRKSLSIPGALIGVSHRGQLLYTQGYRYGDVDTWSDWEEWLDAVAYDGVNANRVDSLALPNNWPHPVLARNGNILIGRPAESKEDKPTTEVWTLPDSGKFTRLASVTLQSPVQDFKNIREVVSFRVDNQIEIYDMTNASDPKLKGRGAPSGCIGYNLEFADGTLEGGLWMPLGSYGVSQIKTDEVF